jgi:hypothetical protein
MPYTVQRAFTLFVTEEVDLSVELTKKARVSRDFLLRQIAGTASEDESFPKLFGGYISFGSFARSTKTLPLDDIDLLLPLDGRGTVVSNVVYDPHSNWLSITNLLMPLADFSDEFGYVNSTKVLNKIKSCLSDIRKYKNADIKKNMEAVTLSLPSYDWVFDIVPAVPIGDGNGNIVYYLIPDGTGDWMRTDPRIDAAKCNRVDAQHNKLFRPTVRLLKYWNQRPVAPALPSYYLETLAQKVFSGLPPISSVRVGVERFFNNVNLHLWRPCPDPKGLGPALDADISNETKSKVADAMIEAGKNASLALLREQQNENAKAIFWWRKVFGERFPDYG